MTKNMSRTLGLDIGTNSIGWCLVEDDKRIVAMGSRIYPVGVQEDSYLKSGTEESRNAARRSARSLRRGYDRRRQRRQELERILTDTGMMFEKSVSIPTKQLYGLRREALDSRLELAELGRVFYLLNQRRGFKSSRKDASAGDEKQKELKGMKAAMNQLEEAVKASGARTIGEYFASLFDNQPEHWHNVNEPVDRIRARFVNRKMYQDEFEAIWTKQSSYRPELLTDELKVRLRDRVIFFQRPLKSAKHLVGKCRFEPTKRVMPRSHPMFQQFRIWQRVRDLRVTQGDRVNEYLTNDERATLGAELGGREEMNVTAIKDLMGWKRSTKLNDFDKLKGNTTVARIVHAVGGDWYWKQAPEARENLWHVLYFATDEGWIERHVREKLGMSDEQAIRFAATNLEPDYGSISYKAAKKILPYLEEGHDFATAARMAGYHHSQDELDDPDRVLSDRINLQDREGLRNPLVQMSVNETARLVNAVIKEHGRPDRVKVELLRELKKPKHVREKMTNAIRDKDRQRDIYRDFLRERCGLAQPRMSDIKKFELWLELEHSESELAKLAPSVDLKAFEKFAHAVSSRDQEKFRLWLECGRISPYTGNTISLSALFSEAIHVEHILPYSRSIDDSFGNKTLCEDGVNAEKENLTPLEYFEAKRSPEELKAFKQRIQHFGDGKLKKFLATEVKDDFLHSQYSNTAYIGTQVRKLLREVCKDVRVTNGQVTGLLRRTWKLNELLNLEGDRKNRDDHRHHALDALVIACTSQGLVQRISRESTFDFRGTQRIPDVGLPWHTFRTDTAAQLNSMLVSYKSGKRLLTTKRNKYVHSSAHKGKPMKHQTTVSIRGPLHEQTLYGQIDIQHKGSKETTYVVRKALTALDKPEQLDNVVDNKVREVLKAHLAACGGKMKEAMKTPVFMFSKDPQKRIPIRSVRMRVGTEEMVELRPKTFVEPGSNYCIAIYEDAKGKRAFKTVSFFEAAMQARARNPLYPTSMDGKPFLMALQQRDLVVLFEDHPDEIQWKNREWMGQHVYSIKKFDRNGTIGLVLHKAANANPDLAKSYPPGTAFRKRANTLMARPVHVDALGNYEMRA